MKTHCKLLKKISNYCGYVMQMFYHLRNEYLKILGNKKQIDFVYIIKMYIFAPSNGEVGEWLKPTVC